MIVIALCYSALEQSVPFAAAVEANGSNCVCQTARCDQSKASMKKEENVPSEHEMGLMKKKEN